MKSWFAKLLAAGALIAGSSARAEGDEARGERLFNQQCKTCHTLAKDAPSTVGPNLHGLFGRKAGTVAGFQASEAMVKSGIVWDDKLLVEYLKDPKSRVPGGKMVYIGLKQEAQQEDMLAFLKKATQ